MELLSPSFLLTVITLFANFIGFLAVLKFKDGQRDKDFDSLRASLKEESDRFKRTKGELYERLNLADGEIIGLKRDISHVREGLSESNIRLNNSIVDFKLEIGKSETRITQHMDQSLTVMKDAFREALNAVAVKS